jgi:hypothetical protein
MTNHSRYVRLASLMGLWKPQRETERFSLLYRAFGLCDGSRP